MDSKLSSILEDLYKLDPELREREAELVPVLEALLRAKPDIELDATFAARLRQKLLSASQTPSSSRSHTMAPSLFNKFAFAGLGGLIAVVIAVPLTYELSQPGGFEEFALSDVSSVPTIKSLGDDAFGTLVPTAETPSEESRATVAYGMGGGGVAAAQGGDADRSTSLVIGEPYPGGEIIQYNYLYTGEQLDLSSISDAVYRKNGGLNIGNLGGDLARAKLGPVDLGVFGNLKLQSFSLTQEDKNGYSVYVDPENGMISINGNEGLWGYTEGNYTPFTEEQVMSNEELIAAANKFLNDYSIDTTGFGAPVVDDRGLAYARMQPVEFRYFPEAMTVTYPLLLDGQPTYSGDGAAYGLYVQVNMRTKTVTSATLNVASSYDKSSYELERDSAKILSLAERGGLYNYPLEGVTETIQIELGTPEIILVNHYSYNNGESEVLFVPALSFPITKNSETNPIYSDAVVIPLVKSVIEQAANEPIYRILEEDVKVQ